MDIEELKNTWQAYDAKIEKSFRLNMRCLELIQSQKVKSKLSWLFAGRMIEISLHVVVIYYLAKFLYNNWAQWYFALSAGMLILFFAVAFINCVRQVVLIKQINYSGNITEIQQKLTLLQVHIIDYVKLSFLVLPTFLAYPVIAFKALANFDLVSHFSGAWWNGQIIFSIAITPLCIWIYRQIAFKNVNKRWVRFIIQNSAGASVTKAMEFIKEIDQFKSEDA